MTRTTPAHRSVRGGPARLLLAAVLIASACDAAVRSPGPASSGDVAAAASATAVAVWRDPSQTPTARATALLAELTVDEKIEATALDVSADGAWIATGDKDGRIAIWSAANGELAKAPTKILGKPHREDAIHT